MLVMSVYGTTRNLPGWLANGSYYQTKRTLATLAASPCGASDRPRKSHLR
jgi:hypothetical protein